MLEVILTMSMAGGWLAGCGGQGRAQDDAESARLREAMVTQQIQARGVRSEAVLAAMRVVPRHLFVPEELRSASYADHPLPIGEGQTISQPYIVGLMSELLEVRAGDKVLEIGTGSGYQAAVLAAMGCEVYSIEIRASLAATAEARLKELGYPNVHVRAGDGYAGWPEAGPFRGIIVTAAPERIPVPLLQQLAVGGRLVIPVGAYYQQLKVVTREPQGFSEKDVLPVRFVPMTGKIERQP
ncbi:MAG TPA: protein-L-isoaspartate(D-aspartate) O-methyltransferase [Thermoanaerobaculaceae bacterium]|nr:protein-L-isoaspartate(D-aspartate) O-methyltransferase [Acidobacteriota bacterium]HPW55236.1 protein-L-isoaspartate(D-aspartate) O-methyltransferase [Thermoanaerobaculaceae bacterium]